MTETEPLAPSMVFTKTALGQTEIQQRSLGLTPMTRRLLVLVDGKRTLRELAEFVPGQDAEDLMRQLADLGCVERSARAERERSAQATAKPARPADTGAAPAAAAPAAAAGALDKLPPAHERTPEQREMARNFMINTINTVLGQNSRITLVRQIFESQSTEELRSHYAAWESAIGSTWAGRRRLDDLRTKLFAVL